MENLIDFCRNPFFKSKDKHFKKKILESINIILSVENSSFYRFLTFNIFIYRSLLWFSFILFLQCYYMYCNLSHYIIIAIVRSDHRHEFFDAEQRDVGNGVGAPSFRV